MSRAALRDPAEALACRKLWLSVLLQQVEFALRKGPFRTPWGEPVLPDRELDWLKGRDGATVCALAGMDRDALVEGINRRRAAGDYWQAHGRRRVA